MTYKELMQLTSKQLDEKIKELQEAGKTVDCKGNTKDVKATAILMAINEVAKPKPKAEPKQVDRLKQLKNQTKLHLNDLINSINDVHSPRRISALNRQIVRLTRKFSR